MRGPAVAFVVVTLFLIGPASPVGGAGPAGHDGGAAPGTTVAPPVPSTTLAPRPASAGGTGTLLVATTDPAAVPNHGLRTNLTAYAENPIGADTSFQIGAAETIGNYEAVFGIFENPQYLPVPFFSVFNNSTNTNVDSVYWTDLPLSEGSTYDFQLVDLTSTTWELTVNGAEFGGNDSWGEFDFGAAESTWEGGLIFSEIAFYPGATPVPAFVNVPIAFAVETTNGWYLPTEASASFRGAGGSPWGVEGRDQHPTLPPDELDTGTSVAPVPNGTALWAGGPVPVRVSVDIDAASAVGTTVVFLAATIVDTSGEPLPGVSLAIVDGLGGMSLASPLISNSSGGIEDAIQLANVSASTSDLVQGFVTTFGYLGSGGSAIQVTPPIELFLSAAGLPGSMTPGSQAEFQVMAVDAAGDPVVGAPLALAITGSGGEVIPLEGYTSPTGALLVQLFAPSAPATLTLNVNVSGDGAWGRATFVIPVHSSAPTFWSSHGGQVELGVAVGFLVASVLVLLWATGRRRRRALPPPIGIRWGPPPGSGPGPGGEPARPPTRTPP